MSETQTTTAQTCHPDALSSSPVCRALAEFAGSFFVCFVAYTAGTYGTVLYGASAMFIALATALSYMACTAVFARFSGGHFNPAVTLAAVLTSKTSWLDGILYVIAQVLGGIAAGALAVAILPTSKAVSSQVWLASAVNGFGDGSPSNSLLSQAGVSFNSTMAMVVEVVMTLLVVAAAIVTMRRNGSPMHSHAVTVGLAYGAATAVAFPVTGAGLNPARSTGIAIFAQGKGLSVEPLSQLWVFWVCPLLAGAIVALVMLVSSTLSQMPKKKAAAAVATEATAATSEDATQNDDESAAQSESATTDDADIAEETAATADDDEHGGEPFTDDVTIPARKDAEER